MSTGNINKKIIVKFVYFVQSAEKSGVHVQTATDSLCGSGGVGDWSFYAHDDRAWEDLTAAIAKAIAGPPKTPFIVNVRMGPQ